MTNVVELKNRTNTNRAPNYSPTQDLARASQLHYLNYLKKQREKTLIEATRDLYSVYMEETEQETEAWKYASLE